MTGDSTNKKGLTIIVPVLNEASATPMFIDALLVNSFYENQFIFVDGGSDDGGDEYINRQHCTLIRSEKERAKQMNLGAKAATFKLLYFLHMDNIPPKNFDLHILEKMPLEQKQAASNSNSILQRKH